MTHIYKISNPHGLSGKIWRDTYPSWAAAADAIRLAYGWTSVVLSRAFDDDTGISRAAYETKVECDSDETGADTPWIMRLPTVLEE